MLLYFFHLDGICEGDRTPETDVNVALDFYGDLWSNSADGCSCDVPRKVQLYLNATMLFMCAATEPPDLPIREGESVPLHWLAEGSRGMLHGS